MEGIGELEGWALFAAVVIAIVLQFVWKIWERREHAVERATERQEKASEKAQERARYEAMRRSRTGSDPPPRRDDTGAHDVRALLDRERDMTQQEILGFSRENAATMQRITEMMQTESELHRRVVEALERGFAEEQRVHQVLVDSQREIAASLVEVTRGQTALGETVRRLMALMQEGQRPHAESLPASPARSAENL